MIVLYFIPDIFHIFQLMANGATGRLVIVLLHVELDNIKKQGSAIIRPHNMVAWTAQATTLSIKHALKSHVQVCFISFFLTVLQMTVVYFIDNIFS